MARAPYLVKYTARTVTAGTGGAAGTTTTSVYRTTFSCDERVAGVLTIPATARFIPSDENVVAVKGYTRKYYNAAGELTDAKQVPDRTVKYLPYGKANARKVSVKMKMTVGTDTVKARYRSLSFTFPACLDVAEIAQALGEIIPVTKIERGETWTVGNIEPYFQIKGGRKYPIPTEAIAEAATTTDVAENEAEKAAALAASVSKVSPKVTG